MDWKRTGKKLLHVLGMVLLALVIIIALLAMLGTVAHASGLVDDTVDAGNLYSKYPLSNYQLDFYVDNPVRALLYYQLCLDYQFISK